MATQTVLAFETSHVQAPVPYKRLSSLTNVSAQGLTGEEKRVISGHEALTRRRKAG